jgi:2-phospho-L-lactate guanylyltransferase
MSTERDIWAVVPMKTTTGSKQRLAKVLTPAQRQHLAIAMFTDVMTALAATQGLSGIVVVTLDPAVTDIAQGFGARVIGEDADAGHTAAVAAGARALVREGRGGMMSIPGDIPLVTSSEIETLLGAHPAAPAFSIVAAHDGRGSNAVLLTPPDVLNLRFGDDSFLPHVAAAEALRIAVRQHRLPGIGLDIDTPADLVKLKQSSRPAHTSRVLAQIG